MDQADRHVYLYAKGHYKQIDTIKDLQQIFAERNGLEAKYILPEAIARMLLSMTYSYIENKHQFLEFVLDLHPNEFWKCRLEYRDQYDFFKAVIGRCLSILMMTEVLNKDGKIIMNLGDPDPKILPLKEDKK